MLSRKAPVFKRGGIGSLFWLLLFWIYLALEEEPLNKDLLFWMAWWCLGV